MTIQCGRMRAEEVTKKEETKGVGVRKECKHASSQTDRQIQARTQPSETARVNRTRVNLAMQRRSGC